MKELLIILFSAILVNNYPLSKFLGICPFLGVSKKLDSAVGMSAAVIFVMLMATAATWPIYDMLLEPNGLAYLQTIVFILVIAAWYSWWKPSSRSMFPACTSRWASICH